jgi:hypothetical protein
MLIPEVFFVLNRSQAFVTTVTKKLVALDEICSNKIYNTCR